MTQGSENYKIIIKIKMENSSNNLEKNPNSKIEKAIETIGESMEISFTEDSKIAICVIKPDAFLFRDAIVEKLKNSGLYIVKRNSIKLPSEFVVGEMYGKDQLPKPVEEATLKHFESGESEIILVEGEDVARKLLEMVGLKTNPALCDPETLRFVYGSHIPEELGDGLKYYRNAAHRSTNDEEVKEDLEKFNQFL
jgi:nucleoside diphosphate kinase